MCAAVNHIKFIYMMIFADQTMAEQDQTLQCFLLCSKWGHWVRQSCQHWTRLTKCNIINNAHGCDNQRLLVNRGRLPQLFPGASTSANVRFVCVSRSCRTHSMRWLWSSCSIDNVSGLLFDVKCMRQCVLCIIQSIHDEDRRRSTLKNVGQMVFRIQRKIVHYYIFSYHAGSASYVNWHIPFGICLDKIDNSDLYHIMIYHDCKCLT